MRNNEDFCVDQQSTSVGPSTKVCDFFTVGSKSWDESKVRLCFNPTDADAIMNTRIPQNGTIDRVAWIHLNNGQYTVKMGYHQWHNNHVGDLGVQ